MKCKYCGREGLEWADSGYKPFIYDPNSGVPHKCDPHERKKYQEAHKPELGEQSIQELERNRRYLFLLDADLTEEQKHWRSYWIERDNQSIIEEYDMNIQFNPPDIFKVEKLYIQYDKVMPQLERNQNYVDGAGVYNKKKVILRHKLKGTLRV